VTLSFTAPAPGRYVTQCSEYCGRGHDDMKSVLLVAPAPVNGGIDETKTPAPGGLGLAAALAARPATRNCRTSRGRPRISCRRFRASRGRLFNTIALSRWPWPWPFPPGPRPACGQRRQRLASGARGGRLKGARRNPDPGGRDSRQGAGKPRETGREGGDGPAAGDAPASPAAVAQNDDPTSTSTSRSRISALSALPTTLRCPRNRRRSVSRTVHQPLDESGIAISGGWTRARSSASSSGTAWVPGRSGGFYRTSDAPSSSSQYDVFKQGRRCPSASPRSVRSRHEPSTDKYSPGLGAIISREMARAPRYMRIPSG